MRSEDKDANTKSVSNSTPLFERQSGHFIAPEFWSSLAKNVEGLRDVLEESEDKEYEDSTTNHAPHGPADTSALCTEFLLGQIDFVEESQPPRLPVTSRKIPVDLFRYRVDTVYKFLHWPSVVEKIEHEHSQDVLPPSCLESGTYFMAFCSITDREAEDMGLGKRPAMLRTWRTVVESRLACSGFMEFPTIDRLQVFVTHLVRWHLLGFP